MNISGPEDLDLIGVRSRGVDSPARIIGTLDVGNTRRGYLDITPTSYGTTLIPVDDSGANGGIVIPGPTGPSDEVEIVAFVVNQATDQSQRFRSFTDGLENGGGAQLDDESEWRLAPESIRIFRVSR
jgi:hypothetical protein